MTIDKIKPKAQSVNYVTTIDAKDFETILKTEKTVDRIRCRFEPLYSLLEKVDGVTSVCYSDNFPNMIDFTVDCECDTPEVHAKVIEIIEGHIKRCEEIVS